MHKKLPVVLFIALTLCGLVIVNTQPFGSAVASTPVTGVLTQDTVWSKTGSLYSFTSNLTIAKGITLTIQPGVQVDLNGYSLTVDGNLVAQGNADLIHFNNGELYFTYLSDPWLEAAKSGCIIQNVMFNSTKITTDNQLRVDHVVADSEIVVNYQKSVITGSNIDTLTINGGIAQISQNTIRTCNIHWGSPNVGYNVIENLSAGWSSYSQGCGAIIKYNTIKTVWGSGGSPIIQYNVIIDGVKGYFDGKWQTIADNIIGGGILTSGISPWISGNTILENNGALGAINVNQAVPYSGDCGYPFIVDNNIFCTLSGNDSEHAGIVVGGKSIFATVQSNLISGGSTGIKIYNSGKGFIGDNYIQNQNLTAIAVYSDSEYLILHNYINNTANGIVSPAKANLIIANNTIKNTNSGITILAPATINQNNIENYLLNSVSIQGGTGEVNASYNWWGTIDEAKISQSIYDGKNNPDLCKVTFKPILLTANPNAAPNFTQRSFTAPAIPDFPSPAPTPPPARGAQIQLALQCTSAQTVQVNIEGTLTVDGTSFLEQPLRLSYNVNGSDVWVNISNVVTDRLGKFSATWTPSEVGYYVVKADWGGNTATPATRGIVYFALAPVGGNRFFTVNSNSTISALSYNIETKMLNFSVSGATGTTGYAEVTIPDTVMNNTSGLSANLDNTPIVSSVEKQDGGWKVSISYHHGNHGITFVLHSPTGHIEYSQEEWLLIAAIVVPILAVLGIVVTEKALRRKHKQPKQ